MTIAHFYQAVKQLATMLYIFKQHNIGKVRKPGCKISFKQEIVQGDQIFPSDPPENCHMNVKKLPKT